MWLLRLCDPSTDWLGLSGNHLYGSGPVTINHFHAPVHFEQADMLFARTQHLEGSLGGVCHLGETF